MRDLWLAMDRAIEIALAMPPNELFNTGFVNIATSIDPRLYDAKSIPDPLLSEFWDYTDEYFDSLTHGTPDFYGRNWEQARLELEARRKQIARAFDKP